MSENKYADKANALEGILRNYLKCHYLDFYVNANDYLSDVDWRTAIIFALGFCYAKSDSNADVKDKINTFIGETLIGNSIADLVNNHERYEFNSDEEAFERVDSIIDELQGILNNSEPHKE